LRILAIETSGERSSVALVQDAQVLSERFFGSRMSLCQTLPCHIQSVVESETLADAALDGLAVATGPGSFTGLRLGVAMAKAIAHATGLPLVGVGTHEIIAWPLAVACEAHICVLHHARKEDVYTTTYRAGAGVLEVVYDCEVLAVGDLATRLAALGGAVVCVGDGVLRHLGVLEGELGQGLRPAPPALAFPRAGLLGAIATPRVAGVDAAAAHNLRPRYCLISQAERSHGIDLGMG